MAFIAECLYCQAKIRVPEGSEGLSVQCPLCHNFFTVVAATRPRPAVEGTLFRPRKKKAAPASPAGDPAVGSAAGSLSSYEHVPLPLGDSPAGEAPLPLPQQGILAAIPEGMQPRRKPLNVLGVIALVFGSAALVLASIPALDFLTLPLAVLGGLLGITGLMMRSDLDWLGPWVPAAGSGLSLAIVAVALFWPSLFGPHFGGYDPNADPNRNRYFTVPRADVPLGRGRLTVAEGPPITGPGSKWVDASRAEVQVRNVRVGVRQAAVAPVELNGKGQQHVTDEEYLVIWLRVTNGGLSAPFTYDGWSTKEPRAELSDGQATSYLQRSFGNGEQVVGQLAERREVGKGGKYVDDVLVFAVPPENRKYLYLELPGSACGVPGTFRLAIPSAFVQR
jgi:hypothetical protein